MEKLWPPYAWRWLAQQAHQRRHADAPVMVTNAVFTLNAWLRDTDRGIEWGSGRSTAWLAARVGHLVSVEHDAEWHARTRALLEAKGVAGRVDYRLVPAEGGQMEEPHGHPYSAVAAGFAAGSLDFAIVDGQMRLRCTEAVINKLRPGGLLVLDGANRYLPNRVGAAHTTVRIARDEPLGEGWRAVQRRLADWRAIHTSDGLWDTRMWVRPCDGEDRDAVDARLEA